MQASPETNKQINKRFGELHAKMRDPAEHLKADLKDKMKKNVERKQKRVGL